jgi:hypothetical protein
MSIIIISIATLNLPVKMCKISDWKEKLFLLLFGGVTAKS